MIILFTVNALDIRERWGVLWEVKFVSTHFEVEVLGITEAWIGGSCPLNEALCHGALGLAID
jgi:hypothetical protein